LTLNEGSITEYLRALIWNPTLTAEFYRDTAILRNDEQTTTILAILENARHFKFNFVLKDKLLDEMDYWEKHLARKSRSASRNGLTTDSMLAPSNLLEIKNNGTIPSLEAVNCIIEQTESQERELQDIGNKLLDLKVQLEMEKKKKKSRF